MPGTSVPAIVAGEILDVWGAQLEQSNAAATEYIPTTTSIRTKFAGITQDGGFGSNIPRLDYTGGGCPKILSEPARTNEILYSEEFSNTGWLPYDATISANATNSPNNTLTADKLIEGTLSLTHHVGRNITNSNSLFTFSVFAKKSERNFLFLQAFATIGNNFTYLPSAYFDLNNGTVGTVNTATAYMENYGDGWYRCILNCTSTFPQVGSTNIGMYMMTAIANGTNSYLGNGTSGIFIWGAQAEAASTVTSYIPTTTATVTRTADFISETGVTTLIGQTEGTIFWDVKDLTGPSTAPNVVFGIKNSTFTNWIGITSSTSASPFRVTARPIGGINIIEYTSNITSAKACVKYGTFGATLFVNGVPVATTAVNPNFTFNDIFFNGSVFSYKTNSFALWKTALTDDQCILLTGPSFSTYPEMANTLIYTLQ